MQSVHYKTVSLQGFTSLASFELALSAEQVKALDEASQIDPGFPYSFYAKEHVRANAYGGMRDQIMA